ncbi:tryptophan--tRNA ligase [Sphingomonas paeninsulae]|jgi:tryptophanyl-tRNA synthetase|uniref:Tryptophan--tRNA ligase n=1 Tax=Sphingomonas paeninsulae TaxID=2319844 RepID=A0A494TLB7_SPHPE|nr:tryptophan--tRNA ligase [Sphingomonas paeninsulae]AYJ85905.1 tryptophan--tRNA ligase [Sphingomonas paeninsulae]
MRVVSGIQPTGSLHLGNYLGAIRNWVRMQDSVEGECVFFLADLHSLSTHEDRDTRRANVREMAAALIAAGIDPKRSVLFNQARVPAHAELCWLLMGTARMGWLNRMTQFKDKAGKNREGSSVALFAYPVLQAADVLLYNATHVPVGDDQKQHLELARDIATKFNGDFGVDLFTLPEAYIPPAAARIMSLRDGTAKMSKSDPSDMSRINLTDDADLIAQKVRKAKTDQDVLPSEPAGLADRPEARNLVTIFAALSDVKSDAVLAEFGGSQFGPFKARLIEQLVATLSPIRERLLDLRDDATIDAILESGGARARVLAQPTLDAAYDATGLQRGLSRSARG